MKVLHYTALEHPRVAMALQGQAWENLKPFRAYLQAAIRAAKLRQVRYRVTWKPAEVLRIIRIKPCDSVFEIIPQDTPFRVSGLPATANPETLPPKLIIDWASMVDIRRVWRQGADVLIELDQAPGDEVKITWAGHPVQVERVTEVVVPQEVFDAAGRPLPLAAIHHLGDRLRLVVSGENVTTLHSRSGTVIPTRRLEWREGLSEFQVGSLRIPFIEALEIQVSTLPQEQVLIGNNGIRFSWEEHRARGPRQKGEWVQLIPLKEDDAELAIDPRAAFCEEGVREVLFDRNRKLRVFGFRRESWQLLLEQLPPEDAVLSLPINLANLTRQKDAIERLSTGPLPHHRGLLQLLEDPSKTGWCSIRPARVDHWFLLGDPGPGQSAWDGTAEQREFVEKALATPDFAFLEGPPGSGKTHAICELVLQLIERGKRILLCSTTHVAVDNVLERLVGRYAQVEALRIGAFERVGERVRACQIDARIEELLERWQSSEVFQDAADDALRNMAERITLASVNLTCGTTTGILAHPSFRGSGDDRSGSSGRYPQFDVLILDEASKTTFQEFLVPALLARRWIVVGDVQQLPPFSERQDLEASLEELSDEQPGGRPRLQLSVAHQRACLLLHRLTHRTALPGRLRWAVVETSEVLNCLRDELVARGASRTPDQDTSSDDAAAVPHMTLPEVVRIVDGLAAAPHVIEGRTLYRELPLAAIVQGDTQSLALLAADLVVLESTLLERCERWLPADLCQATSTAPILPSEAGSRAFRRAHWLERKGRLERPVRDRGRSLETVPELEAHHQRFLLERTWAGEVGWRLSRTHQLSQGRNVKKRDQLEQELALLSPQRKPEATWGPAAMLDLRDVGLRSMLEALRLGRSDHRVRRPSALTEGMPPADWQARAVRLSHQHRMHPDISAFPRDVFYEGQALRDANTLPGRDERVGWRFGLQYPAHRTWIDVEGREHRGANSAEVEAMRRVLERWKHECSGPRHPERAGATPRPWEIACLAFYNRQELAIRDMLRELTGQARRETRFELPHTEIVCGTVDRFQGREADLVLLSLRNTERVGHLDSPNRLNVGITRARHLLLVFGRRSFYQDCEIDELERLSRETPTVMETRRR